MKYAHYIEMRVFSKEEDNEELIISKIKELFPFDFDKEKINIDLKTAFGFEDKKIHILSVSVKNERQVNAVLKNLMARLPEEQIQQLRDQLESRLDDNLHFYLRLDKDLLMNNEYFITDSGNCFHFTVAIAAYPHKREIAVGLVKRMLER
jgi:RNA-binding protein